MILSVTGAPNLRITLDGGCLPEKALFLPPFSPPSLTPPLPKIPFKG